MIEDGNYTSLGRAVGVLETRMLRRVPSASGSTWLARPVRLLVIDPREATPKDWLIWRGLTAEMAAPAAEAAA